MSITSKLYGTTYMGMGAEAECKRETARLVKFFYPQFPDLLHIIVQRQAIIILSFSYRNIS